MSIEATRSGIARGAVTRAAGDALLRPLHRLPLPVLGLAVLAFVLRLPYLRAPLSPDEGGFLMVARQWQPGTSLYGRYWVDRPPLLLDLYRIADDLGGLTPLRLLGALGVSVTVIAVGMTVRRVSGPNGATWAAAVAGGLLVSPLAGSTIVDGELLAAPFVAVGVALAVQAVLAVEAPHGRSARAALGAGACAAAAVLVKQNMLDVAVFAVVLALVSWRTGGLTPAALWRLVARFAAGGALAVATVLGLAMLRGTSPGGVLFAMYPFRWRAASVEHLSWTLRVARLGSLGGRELLTAGPLLLLALVAVLLLARRRSGPRPWPGLRPRGTAVAVATLALAAYDVVSVLAGGSYWGHYLVQLAVPTALAAGLLVAALPRPGRALVSVVLAAAALAWTVGLVHRVSIAGPAIGTAIGQVAEPGDTVVSAFGEADIPRLAGLDSPYPYLWSLPARTLDPHFAQLSAMLAGPRAPTWFVIRGPVTTATLDQRGPGAILRRRYHPVGEVCGRTIYLRNSLQRPAPVGTGTCSQNLATGLDIDTP